MHFGASRQYSCAADTFRSALKLEPESATTLDLLSRAEIADANYGSAIADLRHAPTLVAKSEALTIDLAVAYGKAGLVDEATQLLTKAVHANPASERLNATLVTALVQQTLFEKAEIVAHTFAAQHPRDLAAQRVYLETLVLNNNGKAGQPIATRLLATKPHDPEILFLNGVLERNRNELADARRHLEEAVLLDASRANIHAQLGLTLAALHDDAAAKTQFEQALALGDQDPPTRFALANSLRNLGQTTEAQRQLELYQQQLKASAAQKLATGKVAQAAEAMKAQHPQQAIALYHEAIEAEPGEAILQYKLSAALDRTGNLAEEQAALEQAVQLDPQLAIAQNQLGYLASQRGDSSTAERRFRLAVQASPDYVDAWISLAATLGMEHRLADAREAVANALKLDPRNADALSLRAALDSTSPNP
jgi:Flp pilus assembly protein TadD